jgi:hypothetical protein
VKIKQIFFFQIAERRRQGAMIQRVKHGEISGTQNSIALLNLGIDVRLLQIDLLDMEVEEISL